MERLLSITQSVAGIVNMCIVGKSVYDSTGSKIDDGHDASCLAPKGGPTNTLEDSYTLETGRESNTSLIEDTLESLPIFEYSIDDLEMQEYENIVIIEKLPAFSSTLSPSAAAAMDTDLQHHRHSFDGEFIIQSPFPSTSPFRFKSELPASKGPQQIAFYESSISLSQSSRCSSAPHDIEYHTKPQECRQRVSVDNAPTKKRRKCRSSLGRWSLSSLSWDALNGSSTEEPMPPRPVKVRVVMLGSCRVGKTSLLTMFVQGTFYDNQGGPQEGIDVQLKSICRPGRDDGAVNLQVWDLGGQSRFRSIQGMYLTNCDAAFIVYDVSNRQSFEDVYIWLRALQIERRERPACTITLVGNKIDLRPENCDPLCGFVTTVEGETLASEFGATFVETSARDPEAVASAFESIVDLKRPQIGRVPLKNILENHIGMAII